MNRESHNQNIIRQFSQQAKEYTKIPSHSDGLDELIKRSGVSKQDHVLDIACGSGLLSCAFAHHAQYVTGLDITEQMLEEAKRLQSSQQLTNINWIIGDVNDLPFPDQHFSMVMSRFGFHHFINPQLVFEEMMRVCKPNGVVMVVDVALPHSKLDLYNVMEKNRDSSHVAALSVEALHDMFQSASLSRIQHSHFIMTISLREQLNASFPQDESALKDMIIRDIGADKIGIEPVEINGEVYLNYPIHIFIGRKE
ncbi:hypothetical protein GCM10025777_60790 [Membranihabitans marinus]